MSEPEWSLPMNRADLIARCEALAAELASSQANSGERLVELGTALDRIRELEAAAAIVAEIVALVPLSETLKAAKTGKTLVEWLRARLAITSALETKGKCDCGAKGKAVHDPECASRYSANCNQAETGTRFVRPEPAAPMPRGSLPNSLGVSTETGDNTMVKRYNPHSEIDISASCIEDSMGCYVFAADYDALAAETTAYVDKLVAERHKFEEALQALWNETKLAGNDNAKDYGWPKVREMVLAALTPDDRGVAK